MSAESNRLTTESAKADRTIQAFAELADSLVNAFELDDVLDRIVRDAVRSTPVDDALILVDDGHGRRVAAATGDAARGLGRLEVGGGTGPGADTVRDGTARSLTELAVVEQTWPSYAAEFMAAGYQALHAFPMREETAAVGALILVGRPPIGFSDCERQVAQALADLAALAVAVRGRAHAAARTAQLQHALESRIVVEQAKGVIAQHAGVDMTTAFAALRSYGRARQVKVSTIAHAVVDHQIPLHDVLETD